MSEVDERGAAEGPDSTAGSTGARSAAKTAGTILRETRQAQGLHIAALAASIKVAQKKLEALEGDRFAELPDATFTRALAQTVCRALKTDPAPVLALLPAPADHRLEHVSEGINAPFRDRPGRREPSDWSSISRPAVLGPLLLLIAAGVVYFLPSGWFANLQQLPSPPAAGAPVLVSVPVPSPSDSSLASTSSVMMAPSPVVEPAPAPATTPAASLPTSSFVPPSPSVQTAASVPAAQVVPTPAPTPTAGSLQVSAIAPSWVEVRDFRAKVLIARTVRAGETVMVDGEAPLRLKIGNVRGTVVSYRGQPLNIAANAQNNVARLELK